MIDVLKKLNESKDRCVLIGRSGLNMAYSANGHGEEPFYTSDFDVVCPDLATADECAEILNMLGFERAGAVFRQGRGKELDLLISILSSNWIREKFKAAFQSRMGAVGNTARFPLPPLFLSGAKPETLTFSSRPHVRTVRPPQPRATRGVPRQQYKTARVFQHTRRQNI